MGDPWGLQKCEKMYEISVEINMMLFQNMSLDRYGDNLVFGRMGKILTSS